MQLSQQQQTAISLISEFLKDESASVFILKGYAGTGKTTLIKEIIPIIRNLNKIPNLLAPTGRAARILSDKTGNSTTTIHARIYELKKYDSVLHDEKGEKISVLCENVDENKNNKGVDNLKIIFSLRNDVDFRPEENVFVVDEASMVASCPSQDELLRFGTDNLLNDLLTYLSPRKGGKIIFVGDPAQLPPVGENKSAALDETTFREKGLNVTSYELTDVVRQDKESTILENAILLRNTIFQTKRNALYFKRKKGEVEDVSRDAIIHSYLLENPEPTVGKSIVVCYSNALTQKYNEELRSYYYPNKHHLEVGDILLIVKNCWHKGWIRPLFNGDFVKVAHIASEVDTQTAPVWKDEAGKKERVKISLNFRDVILKAENGDEFKCKIIDTLLNSDELRLTHLQNLSLFINYKIRKDRGCAGSIEDDPYFNAVHVKYGYAITGHKSQGGEWKTVYADYTRRTGLDEESLRWVYTVTTRAKQTLFGFNMPAVTPLSSLKFDSIQKVSKVPKNAMSYADAGIVTYLPMNASNAQKQKCLCVKKQLDDAGFLLESIQTLQYDDRYTIQTPSGTSIIDCYYDGSGAYTHYVPVRVSSEDDAILKILNDESFMEYDVKYEPSNDGFSLLYHKMVSACDELEIRITNIAEHIQEYNVCYFLKTSGKVSYVIFYFDKNNRLTKAIPKSDLEGADRKLQCLIEKF